VRDTNLVLTAHVPDNRSIDSGSLIAALILRLAVSSAARQHAYGIRTCDIAESLLIQETKARLLTTGLKSLK